MPARLSRALVAVGTILVSAAACSPTSNSPNSPDVDPSVFRSEVDPEAGTITLPLHRFLLTDQEQGVLRSAQALAMSRCATAAGVPTPWEDADSSWTFGASRLYGVWYRPEAERYGYGLPTVDGGASEGESASAQAPLDEEALAVYESCNRKDVVRRFESELIAPGFDYAEEVTGLSDEALDSEEAETVFAEWESCLADHRLTVDHSLNRWSIVGTTMDPTESNIRVALLDVECKESTRYVQRLADIEGALQQPVIEDHMAELQEMREEYDAVLELARDYLAEESP